jgi:hypothetical protein
VAPADLNCASRFGVLAQVPVKLRALPSGNAHEFAGSPTLRAGLGIAPAIARCPLFPVPLLFPLDYLASARCHQRGELHPGAGQAGCQPADRVAQHPPRVPARASVVTDDQVEICYVLPTSPGCPHRPFFSWVRPSQSASGRPRVRSAGTAGTAWVSSTGRTTACRCSGAAGPAARCARPRAHRVYRRWPPAATTLRVPNYCCRINRRGAILLHSPRSGVAGSGCA